MKFQSPFQFGCLCAALAFDVASAQTPRTYVANYTYTPPVIDGQIGANEWDAAAPAEGQWHILRRPETDIDAENTRFQMMWDLKYLYILVQSDYGNWNGTVNEDPIPFVPGQQIQGINFNEDNINIYLDPNVDGEENARPDDQVDGYQIAWNQRPGVGSLLDDGAGGRVFKNTGLFIETHVNTLFGNQGRWQGLRQSSFVQSHDTAGGVIEFALAWADIDGPDRAQFAADPQTFPADEGTAHPKPPKSGDKWIFNISRISSDANNLLPVWSWQAAQFFAAAPHGLIEFAGGPRSYEAKFTTTPPMIDGAVNPGEWDAATASGAWHVLRQPVGVQDSENTRFRMMWDSTNLYILVESDYSNWSGTVNEDPIPFVPGQQIQGINFNEDNLNIYLDPNTDGECNLRPDAEVDGYQIAWNQRPGVGSFLDDGAGGRVFKNTGLFLETHINTLFGNQGRWQGLRRSSFVQSHGAGGGVIEFALAWADMDGPNREQWQADPENFPTDVGTVHTNAPLDGDEWIFEISRIGSDPGNLLPVWSWQPAQFFAAAPHGTIRFTGGPRKYVAHYAATPPTIDGTISAGEWNYASGSGGAWHMLRQPETAMDGENSRFRVLWDRTNIYVLFQSDKTSWSPGIGNNPVPFVPGQQIQGINFNDDNINIYLDPNTDGESNFRPDAEVDGYQIAWNQRDGTGSLVDDGAGGRVFDNTGLFLETHINTPFGNQGLWQGLRQSAFVQSHGVDGGIFEFALAWADIDAPNADQFPGGLPADSGTAHPGPANEGDQWIFNISRISSDPNNFLPIWSWQPAQSFAIAPHGILEFSGGPPRPRIVRVTRTDTSVQLDFTTIAGTLYDVEYSETLAAWEAIAMDLLGTGMPVTYEDQDGGRLSRPTGFYRVFAK
jgi:hypothetical protein